MEPMHLQGAMSGASVAGSWQMRHDGIEMVDHDDIDDRRNGCDASNASPHEYPRSHLREGLLH
jgi:hypothetical protein